MSGDKTIAEQIDYYRLGGYSTGMIAKLLSLPRGAVEAYIKKTSIKLGSRDQWDESVIVSAMRMRKSGKKVKEIAEKLNVSAAMISLWLCNNDVVLKKSKDSNREPRDVKELE